MTPLSYGEAWANISCENPLCDACRKPIFRTADARPFQITGLAQRGIINVLCAACAVPGPDAAHNRYAKDFVINLVEACVARASVPQGGDSSMGDTVELTRPHDPEAAAKAAAEDDARQKKAQAAEDAKNSEGKPAEDGEGDPNAAQE